MPNTIDNTNNTTDTTTDTTPQIPKKNPHKLVDAIMFLEAKKPSEQQQEALKALKYELLNDGPRMRVTARAKSLIETAFLMTKFNYDKKIGLI